MSLDIYLQDKGGNEIASMNWFRNPFGLESWAQDNTQIKLKKDLWYVCNHWNYARSNRVNRPLFLEVVLKYWAVIKDLKEGYFYFDLSGYRQFVEVRLGYLPLIGYLPLKRNTNSILQIEGEKYIDNKLAIPMRHFSDPILNLRYSSLEDYKVWFSELVEFANLLQDKELRFYCSN